MKIHVAFISKDNKVLYKTAVATIPDDLKEQATDILNEVLPSVTEHDSSNTDVLFSAKVQPAVLTWDRDPFWSAYVHEQGVTPHPPDYGLTHVVTGGNSYAQSDRVRFYTAFLQLTSKVDPLAIGIAALELLFHGADVTAINAAIRANNYPFPQVGVDFQVEEFSSLIDDLEDSDDEP